MPFRVIIPEGGINLRGRKFAAGELVVKGPLADALAAAGAKVLTRVRAIDVQEAAAANALTSADARPQDAATVDDEGGPDAPDEEPAGDAPAPTDESAPEGDADERIAVLSKRPMTELAAMAKAAGISAGGSKVDVATRIVEAGQA